ncbi:MAG: thylakoid membrane photosystem I accumulation factor [Cyanobacteria bacterium P01_F01_bin.86]
MKHRQFERWQRWVVLGVVVILICLSLPGIAWAGLNDDRYDGNIFALYAGNGSLVPPRVNLAQSLRQEKPIILVFYVDDSSDCKQFSPVISQLQAPYGRAANFVPVMADSIPVKDSYELTEPGYYFQGSVPQTVVLDGTGAVRLNETGNVSYEAIDDAMREIFDLLPRTESVELRRRAVNELNSELVGES